LSVGPLLTFDITLYPKLKSIVENRYKNSIAYDRHQDGAYDNNWVKEYELFYNKQVHSSPCVKRIFFKDRNNVNVGFVDIRPVTDGSEVTETYLSPPEELTKNNNSYIKCLNTYYQYGEKITCVPFIMPESIFGMCIHASVWICLKCLEGSIERPLSIPEIQSSARGTPYTDKEGLPFVQTARILRMSRAYAFYLNSNEPPFLDDERLLMSLYAYVESGLPVILGVDTSDLEWWKGAREQGYHSIVAIGHTMNNNDIDKFIFHDESAFPYVTLTIEDLLKAWHIPRKYEYTDITVRELLVAVPAEVSLAFHRVYQQFSGWLLVLISRKFINNQDVKNLAIRPYLGSIISLLMNPHKSVVMAISELKQPPRYLWYIELFDNDSDKRDPKSSKGFFVRDATKETEFRLLYLKERQTAIYQIDKESTFQRWDNKEERIKI
jgi:hypothetical protein